MEDTWGIPGPTFLAIYGALIVFPAVAGFAWTIVAKLGGKAPRAELSGPQPTVYEYAYLAGGPDRVVDTAIATLVDRGTLRVSSTKQLQLTGPEPADPIEKAVAKGAKPGYNATTRGIRDRLRLSGPMQALAKDLEARGLVVVDQTPRIRRVVYFLYLAVLVLGVVRLIAGIAGERPVGYLIPMLIAAVFATLISRALKNKRPGPRPTSEGARVLHKARSAHGRERKRGIPNGPGYVGGAVLGGAAAAVAFGGLASYPDEELGAALIPPPVSSGFGGGSSGGGSSCSSGGSSCSSGSSGGGGCGGGGCGG